MPSTSNLYRPFRLSEQNSVCISQFSHTSHIPAQLSSLFPIGSQTNPAYTVSYLRCSLILSSHVCRGLSKPYLSFRLSEQNLACNLVSPIRPPPRLPTLLLDFSPQQYLAKNANYEAPPYAVLSVFCFFRASEGAFLTCDSGGQLGGYGNNMTV